MKPAIMALESGSQARVSLQALLLNLCEMTGAGTPVIYCPSAFNAATEVYDLIDEPCVERQTISGDPTWTFEDWRPWREQIRKLCYAQQNTYKMVFAWLADSITANDEDSCGAAMQRAEMALVSIIVQGIEHLGGDHSNFSSWAFGNALHRERRMVLRDAVLERLDRESSVSSPRDGSFKALGSSRDRIDPTLLMRPRTPAPVHRHRHPPKPTPPPPPPDPVLPDDLPTAGRTRLVEVLSHPTNLGLLGLEPKDLSPTMTLSRLRSLVNTLRQGAP